VIRKGWKWLWGASIRRQLIVGVALVHMLLMTIFVLDLVQRQRQFLWERARQHVLFQADLLATSSLHQVISNDLAGLAETLTSLARDRTIRYAMVTDLRGHVLGHTDARKSGRYRQDDTSVTVLNAAPSLRLVYEGTRTIEAAAPVTVDGRPIGWAWVATDLSADRAHLQYVTRAGLVYTLIAILIGTVFAILLARAITKPLRLLLLGTERVSQDRLSQPIPITTRNEVGIVTHAFNEAMGKLAAQRKELRASEEQLRLLNETLERRIEERTAQLEAANKELDAFSYSVSHDLRAPLRSIDGFSQALFEDCHDQLDASGHGYLQRIRGAAQRMGQLIDDLLQLSRLSRTELCRETVDLTALARSISDDLQQREPERRAEFVISEGVAAEGDPRLLQVALENLLGNAWKYTGKQAHSRIELGVLRNGGPPVYFVRDNGVGFDMTYADKLFGAFQRLHGMNEFPGTGIGLATVQRIVHRHGGRAWAEGAINEGATFYFALERGGPDGE
jgi:signal transduction histidine kinase